MQTILIVDNESQIRSSLQGVLEDEGYKTLSAASGEECLDTLRRKSVDVVLLDIWLPGIDGLETLEKLVESEDHPEVIMISGHGNIETAVRATKLGAFDFLEKPLSIERTLIVLKNAIESKRLRSENLEYKKQFQVRSVIVGDSVPMKALRQQIALMAPTNGRVLIYGESGTGKELAARAIHSQSLRKDAMFVEVNCAAIPEELIESELFGHRKGAFSGAALKMGLPCDRICIAAPTVAAPSDSAVEKGQPVTGGGVKFRGRAAERLTSGLPVRPWQELTTCPYEKLAVPERVHVDAYGNVHLCQGISIGNMWSTPLSKLLHDYQAEKHPVAGPLLQGGPAQLARQYGIGPAEGYVDECHLCYMLRKSLLPVFPQYLAPAQVYGM